MQAELPLAVSPDAGTFALLEVEGLEAEISEKFLDQVAGVACAASVDEIPVAEHPHGIGAAPAPQ